MENLQLDKTIQIIKFLNKTNNEPTKIEISRHTNTSYAHTVKCLTILEQKKLVTMTKQGRMTKNTITTKGKQLANKILEAEELYK